MDYNFLASNSLQQCWSDDIIYHHFLHFQIDAPHGFFETTVLLCVHGITVQSTIQEAINSLLLLMLHSPSV
jgi:hypothetical protein